MEPIGTRTIINEQNGNLAFKIISFIDNSHFDYFQRNNFHTLVLINTGEGALITNFGSFAIDKNSILAFSPYVDKPLSIDPILPIIILLEEFIFKELTIYEILAQRGQIDWFVQ